MRHGPWADRWRTGVFLTAAAIRTASAWATPGRWLGGNVKADRILIAPQDLRTADPTVADDIRAGLFVFSGHIVETRGRSPFALPPPSVEWARVLHSLSWLRHLRAAGTAEARATAQNLVAEWLAERARHPVEAFEPEVGIRRLLTLLSQSAFLLDGASAEFYRRYVQEVLRQTRDLHRARPLIPDALVRLRILIALLATTIAMCRDGAPIGRAMQRLERSLVRQILPDGGHISRNPGALIEILVDLLPLRQALLQRGATLSPGILAAIDRMLPMVRFFRHGDGTFAAFNGMGATPVDLLASLFSHDDVRGQPVANATHSGFQRIEADGVTLIMDTGPLPPAGANRSAHAGTLSFELSAGGQTLVINCGAPLASRREWRRVVRTTAAHSTAILGDASSSRFARSDRHEAWAGALILSQPRTVTVARVEDADATSLHASHDGYVDRFGYVHHREVSVSSDGRRIDGHDRFAAASTGATCSLAIRFHLHPSVKATLLREASAVLLVGADGGSWEFVFEGGTLNVEDSVQLADARGVRRTHQIVLSARLPDLTEIRWAFLRLEAPRRPRTRAAPPPTLPLDL